MSEFKFGDEVQYLARSGVWMDARYIYRSFNQHVVLGDNPVNLCYSYSDDIRRKPRTEKMMMQWVYDRDGGYMAIESSEVPDHRSRKIGEPFEHTFEVPE